MLDGESVFIDKMADTLEDRRHELYEQYVRQENCDGEINFGGHIIGIHREVVSRGSHFFECVFGDKFRPTLRADLSREDREQFGSMLKIIGYMYTGKVVLEVETVNETFILAERYEVVSLAQLCLTYMVKSLHITRVGKCYPVKYLETLNYRNLWGPAQRIKEYILANMFRLLESEHFLTMDFPLRISLLIDTSAVMPSENTVAEAIMKLFDLNNIFKVNYSDEQAALLINCIKFPYLTQEVIHEIYASNMRTRHTRLVDDKVFKAFEYVRRQSLIQETQIDTFSKLPRYYTSVEGYSRTINVRVALASPFNLSTIHESLTVPLAPTPCGNNQNSAKFQIKVEARGLVRAGYIPAAIHALESPKMRIIIKQMGNISVAKANIAILARHAETIEDPGYNMIIKAVNHDFTESKAVCIRNVILTPVQVPFLHSCGYNLTIIIQPGKLA